MVTSFGISILDICLFLESLTLQLNTIFEPETNGLPLSIPYTALQTEIKLGRHLTINWKCLEKAHARDFRGSQRIPRILVVFWRDQRPNVLRSRLNSTCSGRNH